LFDSGFLFIVTAPQSDMCTVLCHAEERSRPFAALIRRQATKQSLGVIYIPRDPSEFVNFLRTVF